jgi:carbonic anhydrase/acetyltransferase-like protein (isoleucine patch superfamily)
MLLEMDRERNCEFMLLAYKNKYPQLGDKCFVAENAAVIGQVTMGEDCSVWFGAAIRGDSETITIGCRTNIQDNATIHNNEGHPVVIGDDVSIGHNAVVHGATLGDGVLVGMGAVVLDDAVIGQDSLIAAGAVVTKGSIIPPNSLVMGTPGKIVRTLAPGVNRENARTYVERKNDYLA